MGTHAHPPLAATLVGALLAGTVTSAHPARADDQYDYYPDTSFEVVTAQVSPAVISVKEMGTVPVTITMTTRPAEGTVARHRGGAVLVRLRRLRLADGRPMALETVHLREDLVPITELDPSGSIYEQLARAGHDVQKAAQTIAAVNLPVEEAKLLDQAVGAAALRVVRVGLTGRDVPVEWAETIYRGDRYDFDMVVAREAP